MTAEETLRAIAEYDVKARHGYVDEWTEAEAFEAVRALARAFFGEDRTAAVLMGACGAAPMTTRSAPDKAARGEPMPERDTGPYVEQRDWTVHPGEVLREALAERDMSQSYLAFATGYTQKHINQIVKGHVRITAEAALRLEAELDISARFWMHLQADHDLDVAQRTEHP